MTAIAVWRLVFQTRQYLRGSLWFLPLLGGLAGAVLGLLEAPIARTIDVPNSLQYSASTASTVLSAIVGSTAALTGFVVTVSVLVVQMATGTFSARYMRLWYRDRLLHVLLALLIGTFTFSFTLLAGVEEGSVPDLGITTTGALMAVDMFLFLFFLDRFIHRLRPVAVAALVAAAGRRSFQSLVRAASGVDAPEILHERFESGEEPKLVVRSLHAGSIQAVHGRGLVHFAREHGCVVVLEHVVGDFVPEGAPVISVYGGDEASRSSERRLHGMIALGVERTIEQDPAFALRIMVDIAIRALSPAVNDPTTAVQVLNHLGDTLRLIGAAELEPKRRDGDAPGRVLIPARGWNDFLALGVTEIRQYGASSVQVVRSSARSSRSYRDPSCPSTGAQSRTSSPASRHRWSRSSARRPTSTGQARPTVRASAARRSSAPTVACQSLVEPAARSTGSTASVRPSTFRTRTAVPRASSSGARACQSSPRTRICPRGVSGSVTSPTEPTRFSTPV